MYYVTRGSLVADPERSASGVADDVTRGVLPVPASGKGSARRGQGWVSLDGCDITTWSAWGQCSQSCDGGETLRSVDSSRPHSLDLRVNLALQRPHDTRSRNRGLRAPPDRRMAKLQHACVPYAAPFSRSKRRGEVNPVTACSPRLQGERGLGRVDLMLCFVRPGWAQNASPEGQRPASV